MLPYESGGREVRGREEIELVQQERATHRQTRDGRLRALLSTTKGETTGYEPFCPPQNERQQVMSPSTHHQTRNNRLRALRTSDRDVSYKQCRRGNNFKGSMDFHLKAKARIWPWLSYVCHIRLSKRLVLPTTKRRQTATCRTTTLQRCSAVPRRARI